MVDLEFTAGTVPEPRERQDSWALDTLPVLSGLVSAGLGVAANISRARLRKQRRHTADGTAETHGVPLQEPLVVTAALEPHEWKPEADIVRLAQSGVLRIEDAEQAEGAFSLTRRPMLRLVDPSRVNDPMDQLLLDTLFPSREPDDTFVRPVKSRDRRSLTSRIASIFREARREAETRGYST